MSNEVTCFLRLLGGGGVHCCSLALVVSRPRFALKTKDIQKSLFVIFATDLFLPHPFKFINEIGTVQVIPGLPGIILRLRCELNLLTTELKLCCKFHLIAKTTPLEEVLSLAIPPHPLINHLKRRRS